MSEQRINLLALLWGDFLNSKPDGPHWAKQLFTHTHTHTHTHARTHRHCQMLMH
jgi:hypothetical protein